MYSQELYHYGTKGQKWGIRRYQNSDGSLTPEGKRRYGYGNKKYGTREDIGHRKFANDALKTESKLNKQYNKAVKKGDSQKIKQAKTDLKNFKVDKQKAANILGMSVKELKYRDAEALYSRRLNRATAAGIAGGLVGYAAAVAISNSTSKGRQYVEAYKDAYYEYKNEKNNGQ